MIKNKPVIGIIPTLYYSSDDPYENYARFINMYSEKIRKSGGIPIGILEANEDYTSICDGYLWPGGYKIQKEYFYFIEDALKNNKPLLGICLGAQSLATFFNILEDKEENPTKNYEEIYNINKEKNPYLKKLEENSYHSNYVTNDKESINSARHPIKLNKDSLLYQIFKTTTLNVVSLHKYAIKRLPKSLTATALSDDLVIEAIEYNKPQTFIIGLQYHPEIEEESPIFDAFISYVNNKKLK